MSESHGTGDTLFAARVEDMGDHLSHSDERISVFTEKPHIDGDIIEAGVRPTEMSEKQYKERFPGATKPEGDQVIEIKRTITSRVVS